MLTDHQLACVQAHHGTTLWPTHIGVEPWERYARERADKAMGSTLAWGGTVEHANQAWEECFAYFRMPINNPFA